MGALKLPWFLGFFMGGGVGEMMPPPPGPRPSPFLSFILFFLPVAASTVSVRKPTEGLKQACVCIWFYIPLTLSYLQESAFYFFF